MNNRFSDMPWLSNEGSTLIGPNNSQQPTFAFDDDFDIPEHVKEKILSKSRTTKQIVGENALRLGRLVLAILFCAVILGGLFCVYMIFTSKGFSNFVAIVMAYVLTFLSFSILIYLYVSPLLIWVWSGRLRIIGIRQGSMEVILLATICAFLLLDIAGTLFYHEGMYLGIFKIFKSLYI